MLTRPWEEGLGSVLLRTDQGSRPPAGDPQELHSSSVQGRAGMSSKVSMIAKGWGSFGRRPLLVPRSPCNRLSSPLVSW